MGIDAITGEHRNFGWHQQEQEKKERRAGWKEHGDERWGLNVPCLGEISSEEKPGRASPELLALAAGMAPTRRRPLPRFATAPETIAEMVPGTEPKDGLGPVGPTPAVIEDVPTEQPGAGKVRQLRKYRAKKREQHARELAIKHLLKRQRLCHNCGKNLHPHGLFADRPELAERGGFDVLVCRECAGKVVQP